MGVFFVRCLDHDIIFLKPPNIPKFKQKPKTNTNTNKQKHKSKLIQRDNNQAIVKNQQRTIGP